MGIHSDKSLSEVHESIDPSQAKGKWRKIAAFFGPAYLVSVGYMDPGNWATDLAGGSQFGYSLIWVLLMSNLMALLLQSLSARLGIVQGRDLAQCNREMYPKNINFILYLLAEIAIAACDLAEVLGMAIGLNLLLGIPLLWGVSITMLDTLLLLYLQKLGMRKLEAFIIALVAIIGGCFFIEIILAKPDFAAISKGFVPTVPTQTALYIAIGIIGATIMPHNLYLHSALVQTRKIKRDEASLKKAIKLNTIDSAIALNTAFLVNAAILILAAAVFFEKGNHHVAALKDAHQLLSPLLGNVWASHLFAIALIAAGQSSTVTGTLAGQIVMEGYLNLRFNPWVRRLITRLLAVVPAFLVLYWLGDEKVDDMLIFSQVLLSMQLAFAIIPLIHFVSDKKNMGIFTIDNKTKIASWFIAALIIALNLKLVIETANPLIQKSGHWLAKILIISTEIGLLLLILITLIYPLIKRRKELDADIHGHAGQPIMPTLEAKPFRKIALALDYSEMDFQVIQYALALAQKNTSFILIHIVESASAKVIGEDTEDYETRKDKAKMEAYAKFFIEKYFNAEMHFGFRNRSHEIARIVNETQADLLIVGSHGHKGLKDFIFGETINQVRHLVTIPVFIAQ